MYASTKKVKELIEEFPPGFLDRLTGSLGVGVPPLKLDLALKEQPQTGRKIRKRIEKKLRKQGRLGTPDELTPRDGRDRYVSGELSMRWAIDEKIRPQIVWFLGSTGKTLVALGGRAEHVTQLYPHNLKDRSPHDAELLHVEKQVVAALADRVEPGATAEGGASTRGHWVEDVLVVDSYWQSELVDQFEFLAVVEEHCERGELSPDHPPIAVLLGSPVFVSRRT